MARSLGLQQRPNTFAQTNPLPHFSLATKAADHTSRIADHSSGTATSVHRTTATLDPGILSSCGRTHRRDSCEPRWAFRPASNAIAGSRTPRRISFNSNAANPNCSPSGTTLPWLWRPTGVTSKLRFPAAAAAMKLHRGGKMTEATQSARRKARASESNLWMRWKIRTGFYPSIAAPLLTCCESSSAPSTVASASWAAGCVLGPHTKCYRCRWSQRTN